MVSPLVFGIVADNAGFATGWFVPMASITVGSALMYLVSRHLGANVAVDND